MLSLSLSALWRKHWNVQRTNKKCKAVQLEKTKQNLNNKKNLIMIENWRCGYHTAYKMRWAGELQGRVALVHTEMIKTEALLNGSVHQLIGRLSKPTWPDTVKEWVFSSFCWKKTKTQQQFKKLTKTGYRHICRDKYNLPKKRKILWSLYLPLFGKQVGCFL